ncbi:MAG: hypothetical protein RL684_1687 [Pseudomonadota bacterium]
MSTQFTVRPDDVIEQIMIQCWLFEARGGDRDGAWREAERTLERLLARGLPHEQRADGIWLDPYAANNLIKARAGELDDPAWQAWQQTTHRNAASLPAAPHLYRLTMRREWHGYSVTPGRPVVLRLPLPMRGSQRGAARVRLLEPASALLDQREMPGRIELRVDGARARGPIVAELEVDFVAGEQRDALAPGAALGSPVEGGEELWLRDREGLVVQDAAVAALAARLSTGCADARAYVRSIWRWQMSQLRFGDWHRNDLDMADPLGGLLDTRLADCMLGSSLLIGLCRARGVPARLLTGYLLHPANLGPHSWAEVRVAPGEWMPVDFGTWCYSAGDPEEPHWGGYFLGRVDARYVAEVAPREFTGWGSAPPPERWYRLEKLDGQRIVHSLHALPDNTLFRRDVLELQVVEPA